MAERTESIILDFEVDIEDSVVNIDKLTAANKKLREERKKVNLESDSGKKRIHEINALLDSNTAKITRNTSAIERQRSNIGNYKSALDGVHPVLGKVGAGLEQGASGFKAMTLQALRFIATPIGAILAALVAVFSLLKNALSQNDALMDKFENVTNAVGVVLEVVRGRLAKFAEAVIAFVQLDFDKGIELTAQAFGGLAEEIGNAVTQQQLFLDASRDLEDSQRALRIETARQENEIKRLVVAAKNRNATFDEQEGFLREALKLEEDLVEQREDIAFRDLIITARRLRADKEFQQQSNETFDEYIERLLSSSKLAPAELDKIADKVEALEQARGSSLAFQEKLENSLSAIQEKRAVAIEKQNKALEEQEALERANRRAQNISDVSVEDPLVGAFETRLQTQEDFNKRLLAGQKEAADEAVRNARRSAEAQIEIEEHLQETKLNTISGFLSVAASLFERESEQYKAFATFQTLISTYSTAQKAYEAAFVPPTIASPALGALNVALAIAQGLANLAAIHGVQFWEGGYTGPGRKHDIAGVVHKNEYVSPSWIVDSPQAQPHLAALEAMRVRGYQDGGLVSNSSTQPINQQLEIANVMKNLGPFEVSAVEMTKMQNRVKAKQKLSKR